VGLVCLAAAPSSGSGNVSFPSEHTPRTVLIRLFGRLHRPVAQCDTREQPNRLSQGIPRQRKDLSPGWVLKVVAFGLDHLPVSRVMGSNANLELILR
jgi:hypothetical protein